MARRELDEAATALAEAIAVFAKLLEVDPRAFVPEMYATQELHAMLLDRGAQTKLPRSAHGCNRSP